MESSDIWRTTEGSSSYGFTWYFAENPNSGDRSVPKFPSSFAVVSLYLLAVNSASLVNKVRYIASTLLDSLTVPAPLENDPSSEQVQAERIKAETRTQKAQTYLCEFSHLISKCIDKG